MDHGDQHFMELALEQAREAWQRDEVPIGAVVVLDDQVVGAAGNAKEGLADPTAHAEMLAVRQAAQKLGRWRLIGCTMYVTLEPCPMCAGALISARLDRLVYGCSDPKGGAVESLYRILEDERLNHRLEVCPGMLAEQSAELLRSFFRQKRSNRSLK